MTDPKPKTYSNTYINFYVALSTATALLAGYLSPVEIVAVLLVLSGFATIFWSVLLLKERLAR